MWTSLRRFFASSGWFGDLGEREAARFLRKKGYRIRQMQMRNRLGEIDLIALDGKTIVFVEVKSRSSAGQGAPHEAVTADKRRRLTNAALAYLKRHRLLERPSRFDVVSIVWPPDAARPSIEHFQSAFEAVGRGQMYS